MQFSIKYTFRVNLRLILAQYGCTSYTFMRTYFKSVLCIHFYMLILCTILSTFYANIFHILHTSLSLCMKVILTDSNLVNIIKVLLNVLSCSNINYTSQQSILWFFTEEKFTKLIISPYVDINITLVTYLLKCEM